MRCYGMRSCRHVMCVCSSCRCSISEWWKSRLFHPLRLTGGRKKSWKIQKKTHRLFIYTSLTSLRISCIQGPNARILICNEWPKPGRQHRIYVSKWNENSNVTVTKTTTRSEKKNIEHILKQMTILYEYGNAPRGREWESDKRRKKKQIVFQVDFVVLLRLNDIL